MVSVQQLMTKNGMSPVPHPSCSPNFYASDMFLLPQMKKVLKGTHFANVEEVKQKMAEARKGIKISKFKTVLSSGKMSR